MNIATIYNSNHNPSAHLREATLRDAFEEVGYFVEFRPRSSTSTVKFRSRHQLNKKTLAELLSILEECTGRKIPLCDRGFLPLVDDEFLGKVLDPVCRLGGIHYMYDCKGRFELDVYRGERFAMNLAKWLDDLHKEKWRWVCIEATKLRDDE